MNEQFIVGLLEGLIENCALLLFHELVNSVGSQRVVLEHPLVQWGKVQRASLNVLFDDSEVLVEEPKLPDLVRVVRPILQNPDDLIEHILLHEQPQNGLLLECLSVEDVLGAEELQDVCLAS